MRQLITGWRAAWSKVPNTTDPLAPFGVVTLASSGSEGGPNFGTMRIAQTMSYGVLPTPTMPNTFVAQVRVLSPRAWCDDTPPQWHDTPYVSGRRMTLTTSGVPPPDRASLPGTAALPSTQRTALGARACAPLPVLRRPTRPSFKAASTRARSSRSGTASAVPC